MALIDTIMATMPSVPVEVAQMWLQPIAEVNGWPPRPEKHGDRWRYILQGKPIADWNRVKWEKVVRSIEFKELAPQSQLMINGLIDVYVFKKHNDFSNLHNGQERFSRALNYVIANGTIPESLIAMPKAGKLELVDGSHRLAALFTYALLRANPTMSDQLSADAKDIKENHAVWLLKPPERWEETKWM